MNNDHFYTRRQLIKLGAGLAGTATMCAGMPAFAQRLQINPNEFRPIDIAIPNFVAGTPADGEVGVGVTQVITNNLKRSGLFAPIDQAAVGARMHAEGSPHDGHESPNGVTPSFSFE